MARLPRRARARLPANNSRNSEKIGRAPNPGVDPDAPHLTHPCVILRPESVLLAAKSGGLAVDSRSNRPWGEKHPHRNWSGTAHSFATVREEFRKFAEKSKTVGIDENPTMLHM
jgi:hypothetical protein